MFDTATIPEPEDGEIRIGLISVPDTLARRSLFDTGTRHNCTFSSVLLTLREVRPARPRTAGTGVHYTTKRRVPLFVRYRLDAGTRPFAKFGIGLSSFGFVSMPVRDTTSVSSVNERYLVFATSVRSAIPLYVPPGCHIFYRRYPWSQTCFSRC